MLIGALLSSMAGFADAQQTNGTRRSAARRISPSTDGINLSMTTDLPAYTLGQTIVINADASYSDGSPVQQLKKNVLVIKDGAGRRVFRGAMGDMGNGSFSHSQGTAVDGNAGSWKFEFELEDTNRNKTEQELRADVTAGGAPCGDADGDGYNDAACGGDDCDDSDPAIHPGAEEICGDGIDQDCSGADLECSPPPCDDADGDGYNDAACGGDDCNDSDPLIHPGAEEICGDGIDQNCTGADRPCGEPHADLQWAGPETCLQCHENEANEVHGSVMYQWKGDTPHMVNGEAPQGKIAGGVNSYCINILGNWGVCGNCHVGFGALPEDEATPEQLTNIDCMVCHQKEYRRTKVDGVFVPDTDNMAISMDEAARTVHKPVRWSCLQCHAKAGGGDAVKRGDLTLAQAYTTDSEFDVHMATTGANLECQECHTFTDHRVAGKGSDLRPTDSDVVLECANCHTDKASGNHGGSYIDRHTGRVACQTCHIPIYAKDASDSTATEATEVHRTWLDSHSEAPPYHPVMDKANDLIPEYRFWNRFSDNYLLGDVATVDSHTGRYPTSRPMGDVADPDAKLYAFKYKTAQQPITNSTSQLIALDTSVFFATGDYDAATVQGLVNMGLDAEEPYSWIETDTFQMLNHQVSPSDQALECNECHGSNARMDLQGDLGYALKGPISSVCTQCHGTKESKPFTEIHDKHVKDKKYDCSYCHEFSRPERALKMP
mgnify:CR=1 FL=1